METKTCTSGLILYAVKNANNHYLIPDTENYFGGIKCPLVMFDSGCNGLMLPFPEDMSFQQFEERFGKYSWDITSTEKLGTFNAPTLVIKRNLSTRPFPIKFQSSNTELSVDLLRFSLSYDDVLKFVESQRTMNKKLTPPELSRLTKYLEIGKIIKHHYPRGKFGEKRKYAILGQQIMKDYYLIQTGDLQALVDPLEFNFQSVKEMNSMLRPALYDIKKKIPEFNEIEDVDHDGDYLEIEQKSIGPRGLPNGLPNDENSMRAFMFLNRLQLDGNNYTLTL